MRIFRAALAVRCCVRKVSREIVDDGVEFIIRPVRAFVHHVRDDLFPTFFGVVPSNNNLRSVTAAADLLHCGFTLAIGQLRR